MPCFRVQNIKKTIITRVEFSFASEGDFPYSAAFPIKLYFINIQEEKKRHFIQYKLDKFVVEQDQNLHH